MSVDRERRLLVFVESAAAALRRGQSAASARLLAITMCEALEAGCPRTAETARVMLLAANPRHRVGRSSSAAEALRDEETRNLLSTVRRGFPFEEAELWADSRPADDRPVHDSDDADAVACEWLNAAAVPDA